MPLSCRFYSQKFPEIEDVVMVTVREIAEMGAYVDLLEYNNIEGMILFSELSRRRIRSINKLLRVGKTEPLVVMRVDSEKGYIDLSKRRVTSENIEQCTETFSKAKAVYSILRHVAGLMKFDSNEKFEELYRKTAWHFEAKSKKKGSAYDIFKQSVNDPSILDECGLDEKTKEVLLGQIVHKLTLQSVKIRSDIEVACYGYEGIDAVKAALQAGLSCSNRTMQIKINLIAPPLYVMTTNTPEKQDGLALLEEANETIKKSILAQGGKFEMKMAPKVVTDVDEVDLQKQMDAAEAETRQVAGDDEQSDSGDETANSGDQNGVGE